MEDCLLSNLYPPFVVFFVDLNQSCRLIHYLHYHHKGRLSLLIFSPFSPFASVSLCGVASLAATYPSFSVNGPFLPDVPGFPLGRFPSILVSTTARMFSVSPLLLTCPNHSNLRLIMTTGIGTTFLSLLMTGKILSSYNLHNTTAQINVIQ